MSLEHIRQEENVAEQYGTYLTDESGIVTNGQADRIFFPQTTVELQEIVLKAYQIGQSVTVSGGGTGIAGGRVPHAGWIIATDDMRSIGDSGMTWTDPETNLDYEYDLDVISDERALLTVPVAMTVKAVQNLCRDLDWFYPPDPTERSAYLGGNFATNASGARSFKFGVTRDWVQRATIILPDGTEISLDRNGDAHELTSEEIILRAENRDYHIPRPTYDLPDTTKNVAGPVITDESQPIDLFIGTGGMFGIVTELTLVVRPPPESQVSMFLFTETRSKALDIIKLAQRQRNTGIEPVPMSVEYLGPRAVAIMRDADTTIPDTADSLVMLEQEATSEDEMFDYLEFWWSQIEKLDILETSVAQSHHEIEHHKFLRHKVPETVNATVKSYGQAKLGTDYAVPSSKFPDLFDRVFATGEKFEAYQEERKPLGDGIGYAFWAHAGDSHIHLNLLPRDVQEDNYAKSLVLDLIELVVGLDGTIAAEHGLGKKKFGGKLALTYQYGSDGIQEITAMKDSIDEKGILNPGNLIGYD